MAGTNSIPQVGAHQSSAVMPALQLLEDKLTEATTIVSCLEAVAGDQVPDWLFVFSSTVRGIDEAMEVLCEVVRVADRGAAA